MTLTKDGYVENPPLCRAFGDRLLRIDRGDGCYLWDAAGRRYLDFGAGISVNALGHNRQDLIDAAAEQMAKVVHTSNLYTTEPVIELATRVTGDRFAAVQFMNSGAEANETALKFARLYARRGGNGGHEFVCFENAFHGRTMGALSVTPTPKYQEPFAPLVPGIRVGGFNDPDAATRLIDGSVAAVIVEVVQGEGGLTVMTEEFARAIREAATRHGVLVIADEIQTGLARTGTFYASDAVGLEPDIITLAKPIAGGLPLSAVLIPERVNAAINPGDHGSTFAGGPVTCAVACRIWDTVSPPAFVSEVARKGRLLAEGLEGMSARHDYLGAVCGKGLLAGVEVTGGSAEQPGIAEVLKVTQRDGLLALRSGTNILRIAPPLTISDEEIGEGLEIIERAIAELEQAS